MLDRVSKSLAQTMVIENEAKYRNLFSNMNLGIMEVDNDERILYVNPSFERISGYSQDELLGNRADTIFLTELSEKEIYLQERRNRQHGKEGLYEIKIKIHIYRKMMLRPPKFDISSP